MQRTLTCLVAFLVIRRSLFTIGVAAGAALYLASIATSVAQDKVVNVSTLDWPPYTGSELPRGGATTEVVRAAFAKMGYEINPTYWPWKRAIDMAMKGSDGVIAYFPGYHCHHREGFVASEPIGNGPLGFAEHVDAPMSWQSLDDIGEQKLTIGTVVGYANTDEFDAKVGSGWIQAIPSNDDVTNLKKLVRKRIDAVVIDKLVLEYLKVTEESLRAGADKLRFDEKPLEDKTLYLCFRGDDEGRKLKDKFNTGLEGVDVEAIVDGYFATAFE